MGKKLKRTLKPVKAVERESVLCLPRSTGSMYTQARIARLHNLQGEAAGISKADLPLHGESPILTPASLAYQNDRPAPKLNEDIPRPFHEVAEEYVYIDTEPLRFQLEYKNIRTGDISIHNRDYLKPMYDACEEYPQGSRNQIWCTSRQCEKSTTMASKAIVLGIRFNAYKTLFISPRFDQVSVFSGQRFKPMAEDSPKLVASYLDPAKCLWQVGQREFKNRSFYNFRSCYATADGSRGITAHHLAIDEIQDIISDNIPVLEECQSHFGWDTGLRYRTYAGTPKSMNNTITRRFNESCQFEMMTKCRSCDHWNFPDEKIIGINGYVCTKCDKEIFPKEDGAWIAMRRDKMDTCWGFHVTQMAVPFKTHADIKEKMEDPLVSQAKFYNECLGLPYDSGEMVLTESTLRQACDERRMIDPAQVNLIANRFPMFAGLDHGSGEGDSPSYTVLAIGYLNADGKFELLYMKRFLGKDSALSTQPAAVNSICDDAGIRAMMADWGFGAHQNARLVDEFGWVWASGDSEAKTLMQCQYVNQNAFVKFDEASFRYRIDRTASMERTITAIKNGMIRLFNWNDFNKFKDDFTSIFIEYNETTGKSKFDHVDNDDCFHAVSYAYMAALQFAGKLSGSESDPDGFLQPGQVPMDSIEMDPDDDGGYW